MTKKEILQMYINDLINLVSATPARDNRINMLFEELEKITECLEEEI